MEWLIRQQVPQRTAHEIVGCSCVKPLSETCRSPDSNLPNFKILPRKSTNRFTRFLGARRAVAAFVSYGSTAPAEVDRQIARWKERLKESADGKSGS